MLTSTQEVARRIKAGERLLLAAEEEVLDSLPSGNWIGGTTPYFMADTGGIVSRHAVFVSVIPPEIESVRIETYDQESIARIHQDTPENGVTFLILPADSPVLLEFAQNAPDHDPMQFRPLLGWISGVHLDDLGSRTAKVFDGRTGAVHSDKGVAMHGKLVPGKHANLGIINLFQQGDGDVLTFPKVGFHVEECLVNGEPRNLAEYLVANGVDTRVPMVDGVGGSNVSFQTVDSAAGSVDLFAPVFPGMEYRIAEPISDYLWLFHSALPRGRRIVFSCNCILNFLYSDLEGKITEGMTGPVTFGEIAHQLLNQTLVYLSIDDA
ncbi:MAG TPA: hypothetical protein VN931_12180 [Fibrobacteria bacterium]|nr:hypothetical protein [Fibrobacteria bacterium]